MDLPGSLICPSNFDVIQDSQSRICRQLQKSPRLSTPLVVEQSPNEHHHVDINWTLGGELRLLDSHARDDGNDEEESKGTWSGRFYTTYGRAQQTNDVASNEGHSTLYARIESSGQ